MAFSSSSLIPSICVNGTFISSSNHCMLGKWSPRSCASSFKLRGLSTATTTTAIKAVQNQDSPGPWLMLPPEYEDGKFCKFYSLWDNEVQTPCFDEAIRDLHGDGLFLYNPITRLIKAVQNQDSPKYEIGKMSYKFYSLFDNKVQTHCPNDEIRDFRLTCRGSSHGWLALLGPRNEGFFLYNPVTRRHIKLPSIFNLPILSHDQVMRSTSPTTWRDVDKLILTCSPDEDEENCRAVMINGFGNMLAICCPGKSKEWTMMRDEERGNRAYEDCVYSTSRKLLYGLTNSSGLETWDLGDPSSPKLIKVDKHAYNYSSFVMFLRLMCLYSKFLVVAGEDLLLVVQYIADVGPDGSCFDDIDEQPRPDNPRHMTIRFDVFKHDPKKGRFKFVDNSSSLGGFAIFVGQHHDAVAIPATQSPELKPDSIYFTDGDWEGPLDGYDSNDDNDERFDGRDIGIYNYRDKTVSECYYPWDIVKNKVTTPIWFFPSSTI